jgi:hypothetical protein
MSGGCRVHRLTVPLNLTTCASSGRALSIAFVGLMESLLTAKLDG